VNSFLLTSCQQYANFIAMKNRTIKVKFANVTVKVYTRTKAGANGKTLTFFQVSDLTSGKRVLRGYNDEAEARREALRIARQTATGQTQAALMSNAEAASYSRAIDLLRPLDVSLEVAIANYAKACEILGGDFVIEAAKFYTRHRADKIERKTVSEAVKELIDTKKARGKSGRYLSDLRARLNRFSEDFQTDISAVTGPDIQAWLDRLRVAPQTAKNFRTVLFTLFSFAESRGYILKGSNPVADTEGISTKGDGAIEIYTPEEIEKLLKAATPEFMPVIALGAFAGIRVAEIERLEWHDLDFTGGFVHVGADKAKTRSRRLVPMLPNLLAWLAPYACNTGKVWKPGPNLLRDARAETTDGSGVAWKGNALRHSFISYRLADIQNAAQVALEAGNSPQMVFQHYRELVKPSASKAWFAVAPAGPANVVSMPAAL
jgi:integrase